MITLFETDSHKNVMFNDLSSGKMVQANQHVIINDQEGMLLDPGGHKVHTALFAGMSSVLPISALKHIFFSHQDPDIIAAANAWFMMTDATGYLSGLWQRFITHFGVDEMAEKRIKPIPDKGMTMKMGGADMKFIPAHYLHSSGNFQVYDPISKILYTGDLGASLGHNYDFVEDFDAHIQYMEVFHKRYMPSTKALKLWVNMVRTLDIDMIAPQHGAIFKGKELSGRFIDWLDTLTVGADVMGDVYSIPA